MPADRPHTNSVTAHWEGGWRCRVKAAGFDLLVDEPENAGGTGTGPMPTEYLLAAMASCYALALRWSAGKRGVDLPDLAVTATGTYDGPRFCRLVLDVATSAPAEVVGPLIHPALRVCYVSNTIATSPPIEVLVAGTPPGGLASQTRLSTSRRATPSASTPFLVSCYFRNMAVIVCAMSESELGARIAALREARGMTGEQLGLALGLSRSQVSKVEHGTRRVDVSEVAAVADALEVSLAEVLGVERSGSLALAARVMAVPQAEETLPARRRIRQLLEADANLVSATGLGVNRPTQSGRDVLATINDRGIASGRAPWRDGEDLADLVRQGLGLGRAPIADVAELAERHFGLDVLAWPTGQAVSGLCAHGHDVAMMLISTSFPRGHQRFTAAHELAHHLLRDPREVVIDGDLYNGGSPIEKRANAFGAALLMPADGLRDVIAGRPVDEAVLDELMRHFGVSFSAVLYRLASSSVGLLSAEARNAWLQRSVSSVLRAANDPAPEELTVPDESRRIPPRLWRAAQAGYQNGRVGIGTLAALADEDAEQLFIRLAADDVRPPTPVDDDLQDL